jgi:hypothetical protein
MILDKHMTDTDELEVKLLMLKRLHLSVYQNTPVDRPMFCNFQNLFCQAADRRDT